MRRFPEGAILVTIDVVGLYPNIPHHEGLEAIKKILNTRTDPEITTDDIFYLAEPNKMVDILFKNVVRLLVRKWRLLTLICSFFFFFVF